MTARAGARKLRGLAAGRGAEVGDRAAGEVAEQPGRERGGGVLHPPGALAVAGKLRHRPRRGEPHRAGGRDDAAERRGPALRIGFDGEVERRLGAVGKRDGVRGLGAVGPRPACEQPLRRIEVERLEGGDGIAFAGDPPQHGVDEAGIAGVAPVGLHEPHREVDGGMVGHIEKQDLRGTDKERGLDPRRFGRKPAAQPVADQPAQRAEPAQHGRDDAADQRPVALGERGEASPRLGCVELLVERPAAHKHRLEELGGDTARGKPRRGTNRRASLVSACQIRCPLRTARAMPRTCRDTKNDLSCFDRSP